MVMGRRQQWTIELLDEAIDAVGDKLARLYNAGGADPRRLTRLQQAGQALRADRDRLERRESRVSRAAGDRVGIARTGADSRSGGR